MISYDGLFFTQRMFMKGFDFRKLSMVAALVSMVCGGCTPKEAEPQGQEEETCIEEDQENQRDDAACEDGEDSDVCDHQEINFQDQEEKNAAGTQPESASILNGMEGEKDAAVLEKNAELKTAEMTSPETAEPASLEEKEDSLLQVFMTQMPEEELDLLEDDDE